MVSALKSLHETADFWLLLPIKQLTYVNATIENLSEQVRNAQLIFGGSGDTSELVAAVKTCPDFAELIQGKVYAGSSAGAYLVATKYFSNDNQEIRDGVGVLPIAIVGHIDNKDFCPDQQLATTAVKTAGKDLEVVILKDYEWIVREQ